MWKDNSIRVVRRHVLSSTDEKSFDLGSVDCFPHLRTKLAKKTRRSPSCQNRKSPSTATVAFRRSPSVICSVDNEPDLKFVNTSYQTGYKAEYSSNLYTQNTNVVQPNVYFKWN